MQREVVLIINGALYARGWPTKTQKKKTPKNKGNW
jgi:hypothetical protein